MPLFFAVMHFASLIIRPDFWIFRKMNWTRNIGFLLILAMTAGRPLYAGDGHGSIAGVVVSRENGQPLPFANVLVEGTKWGTKADEKGGFIFESIPPGVYTITARLLGYTDGFAEDVRVEEGKTTGTTLRLSESAIPFGEIQVTAERARKLEDIRSSLLAIAPFRAKTLAGVGEDVMRTLQALPGVLSPNDFTAQLIVRGSGPDQNLIVMDDIEIFNPYRLYGIISMFNPETASDINLITGGFPAKYGDRLSAVLDVKNKEGDKSRSLSGSVNASITNANVVLNGRSPFGDDGSYLVSARRTYYDLILGPIAKHSGLVSGDVAFPNFSDLQYKIVTEPGGGHRIIANGLFSKDAVAIVSGPNRSTPDSVNVTDETRNDVLGLAWHYIPSKNFFSKLSTSWYRSQGTSEFGGDFLDPSLNRDYYQETKDTTGLRLYNVEFDSRYIFRKISLKEEMGWFAGDHTIELGGGIDLLKNSIIWHFRPDETLKAFLRSRGIAWIDDFVQSRDYERLNVFLQDKIHIGERLSVQPGIRLDYYGIIGSSSFQPRLNVSYVLDAITTVRGAWGIYKQSPGYEKLFDQNAFYDLTNAATGQLRPESATHYVLGLDRWISNEWQFRIESYYKKFDDVIVQEYLPGTLYQVSPVPGGDPRKPSGWTRPAAVIGDSLTTLPINGATGDAYGLELLLEKRNAEAGSRLSGWLGYSLAKAERTRDNIKTPFRFDQRHTVNLVLDYRLSSWLDVGIRWRYGTNFPYTPPIGVQPRVVSITQNGVDQRVLQTDSQGHVVFDIDRGGEANRYSARLPAYHRLDLRATARAGYWGLDWNFYLDVINVYNRHNLLAYRFYLKDDLTIGTNEVTMLPLLPTLGVSVRF
jgi:hypothetical protein